MTEEAVVDSPQAGLKIHVRDEHPVGMARFVPDGILLFVHGATYPASNSFDLQRRGMS